MLGDFCMIDVSRLLDPKVVPTSVLRSASVERPITAAFGTPGFMAPEQEHEGIVNGKTDIFGWGVTFRCLFQEQESLKSAAKDRQGDITDLINEMTLRSPEGRSRDMVEVTRLLVRGAKAAGVKLPSGRAPRR